jgi:hypothetical protein
MAGSAVVAAARLRLSLYRVYLQLIMWVEAVPRNADAARLARLRRLVLQPLARTLEEWSAHH